MSRPGADSVSDQILRVLSARPAGVTEAQLADWEGLKLGTVKKHLKRLGEQQLVVREMRSDRFVWKLRRIY